nr:MAG TPA: ESX-3 secretion system protein EccD3 VII Secretion System ESX-3 [Caudoviricetes sp.]
MSYLIVSGTSLVVGALICLGCLLWSIDRSI